MLIDSPRLTDDDRVAWAALSRNFWQNPLTIERRANKAKIVIQRALLEGPAYVSISWGKDSLVVAHLARQVDPNIPLIWFRLKGIENPEQFVTRDLYLQQFPSNYVEMTANTFVEDDVWYDLIKKGEQYGRRIMGIRSKESAVRALSCAVHGHTTLHTCRPIIDWTTKDVFAYLIHFDIPIPATYAMSNGGRLDIERLRTDFLGNSIMREEGRRDWEFNYFGVRGRGNPPTPDPDEE